MRNVVLYIDSIQSVTDNHFRCLENSGVLQFWMDDHLRKMGAPLKPFLFKISYNLAMYSLCHSYRKPGHSEC